jgi:AraC-like DNA-binding protein
LLWVRGRREERLSDVLLGWVLVGLCFNIWEYMLGFGGLEFLWRELEFFPRSLGFLLAPLCYFYLKSQFNAAFRFRRHDLWHALPFLIDTSYHVLVFLQGPVFVEHWKETVHYPYHIDDIVFVAYQVQALYYIYRALTLYQAYRDWAKTQFSDVETISFRWFRNLILAMSLNTVVGLTVTLLDIWLDLTYWQDWWDELFGAVLIYYVSITGYAQIQPGKRLTFQEQSRPVSEQQASTQLTLSSVASETPANPEKIAGSSPMPPDLANWKSRLLTLMDTEKPYLEPDLSLADLARRLPINAVLLSQIINAGAGKNFNDFVNEYRVEEFKRQVHEPAKAHLTLLGIALDCGFNSKATFNRAFKKCTGLSPKEFAQIEETPVITPIRAT